MSATHLLFCTLCFFGLSPLFAQPLNRSLHRQPVNMADELLPSTIGGAWLIGGATGQYMGYPAFQPYLALLDAQGVLLWERYLDDPEAVELGGVNSLSEDPVAESFYVAGSVTGCDYLIPGYLYRLDKYGETIWFRATEDFYTPVATALPSEEGVLAGDKGGSVIEWRGPMGGLVTSMDFDDEYGLQLLELLPTGAGAVVLFGKNQLLLTKWTNGAAVVTARLQLEETRSICQAPLGRLAVLARDHIYLLDDSLNILQEQNLNNYGSFGKVSCAGNRCYAGGQSPDGAYIALSLDAELNYLQTIHMGPGYNYPTGLAALEDGLLAIGNALPQPTDAAPYAAQSVFSTTKGSDIFLRSWDAAGNPAVSWRNISVEVIAPGQYEVATFPDGCGSYNGAWMRGFFSEIEVLVRNRGLSPIERIELNAVFTPCWFICYTQQNVSRTFEALSLAPGEIATLSFGDVETWGLPLQSALNLCIWASGPDGQLDDDFSDNRACFNTTVTKVKEEKTAAVGFTLYPNPASAFLEVQFDAPLTEEASLKVFRFTGQCLYREELRRGQSTAELLVEELPAGLYYLLIKNSRMAVSQAWIKK